MNSDNDDQCIDNTMSDEFRRSIINRLPPMEATRAPWAQDSQDDNEEEELADEVGDLSQARSSKRYTPISASEFFEQAVEVTPPGRDTVFRAYLTPPKTGNNYLVCHHGAGASGLSFAALAKEVTKRSKGELGVLSFDARGHGKTKVEPKENEKDLSLPTLLADFVGVIEQVFPDPKAVSLILIGHSMGAAPVLSACPVLQGKGYKVAGVGVLDVVEGTAVESLPIMKSIIAKRPTSFNSVSDAIQWHLQSNSIRDVTSACVSVPSYVIPGPGGSGPEDKQVWRTDLLATEPYWAQWYEGLSERFVTSRCARILVLAGQERLDNALMVGQMQGKFQLEVMQDVGHYLQEDNPAALADKLVAFWRRNTQVLVLPPKIGAATGVPVKQVGQQ